MSGPICTRLLTDDHKTYRDVNGDAKDDLTNMIQLVSEPYWSWRREDVIDERKRRSFQFDCDPRSSRRRVKCYLRICDLFFDLLSYMTTLTLVVLPVVVSLLH